MSQRRKSSAEGGVAAGGGDGDGVGSTGGGVAGRGAVLVRLCSWTAFAGVPVRVLLLGVLAVRLLFEVYVSRPMW